MPRGLTGTRVLVVEDEYYIAAELKRALAEVGAMVIGPVGKLEQGLELAAGQLDAALLDVNLHGESSFGVAELLERRGVPYMFLTGYDSWAIPPRYEGTARLTKPYLVDKVIEAVEQMVARA
jgi:DNA-binding response OmpR family regulator